MPKLTVPQKILQRYPIFPKCNILYIAILFHFSTTTQGLAQFQFLLEKCHSWKKCNLLAVSAFVDNFPWQWKDQFCKSVKLWKGLTSSCNPPTNLAEGAINFAHKLLPVPPIHTALSAIRLLQADLAKQDFHFTDIHWNDPVQKWKF